MCLVRVQLAFDHIDLATRCGLRIFGDPLGGARRGARHLMREAISLIREALRLMREAISMPITGPASQHTTARPWPCSRCARRAIKGNQWPSSEIAPRLPCSRCARRAPFGCARAHAPRPPSGAMHAHTGLCRRRQGRRGAGMPRGYGGWRPPDEGGNPSQSIAIQ